MVSPRYTVPSSTVEPALELVRKYNVPGPRYTSYPTAPQFAENIDRQLLRAEIAADNADSASPLSLYFHVPFCESLCWYCGCTTVITRRRASAGDYVDLLIKELELTAPLLNRARPSRPPRSTASAPRSTSISSSPPTPRTPSRSTRAA
jgi:oxygen-independent coproporphyrinogen-3 oxidase